MDACLLDYSLSLCPFSLSFSLCAGSICHLRCPAWSVLMIGNYSHARFSRRQIIVRQVFQENEYGAPAPFIIARAWARASGGFAPALGLGSVHRDGIIDLCWMVLCCRRLLRDGQVEFMQPGWLFRVKWQLSVSHSVIIGFLQRHPGSIAHARALFAPTCCHCYTEMPARLSRSTSAVPRPKQGGNMLLAVCFVLLMTRYSLPANGI